MRPPSFTLEEFFRHANPEGVTRAVLIQMSFYGVDQRYLLDQLAASRGTCAGVAVIDVDADDAEAEMRRLAQQGVRGFRIRPGDAKTGDWLAGKGMATLWKHAADTGTAVCPLINPDALPSVDAMCRRYPGTVVVIDSLIDAASGTFGVFLEVPNPDSAVPAGIKCRATAPIEAG